MAIELCEEPYTRASGERLLCQYPVGHPRGRHSWAQAAVQDMADCGPDVERVLVALEQGRFDSYLEAILAGAHARKRALRGVCRPYGVGGERYGAERG